MENSELENKSFTPGPWKVRHTGCFMVEPVNKNHWGDTICACGNNEANAALIAEAPELLEALKQLVHLHMCEQEGMQSGMPTAKQWLNAVDVAVKAIAKAEKEVSNG